MKPVSRTGIIPTERARRHSNPCRLPRQSQFCAPNLRALFLRCFEEGHAAPDLRPDAATWANALMQAEDALVTCARNAQHRYGNHLLACPWCERTEQLGGRDPFPLQTSAALRPSGPRHAPRRTQTRHYAPGHVRAIASHARTHANSNTPVPLQSPATSHQSPTSPTGRSRQAFQPSTTGNPGNVNWPAMPNYPAATWTALSFMILALMVPGFHLFFAVFAMAAALVGWYMR